MLQNILGLLNFGCGLRQDDKCDKCGGLHVYVINPPRKAPCALKKIEDNHAVVPFEIWLIAGLLFCGAATCWLEVPRRLKVLLCLLPCFIQLFMQGACETHWHTHTYTNTHTYTHTRTHAHTPTSPPYPPNPPYLQVVKSLRFSGVPVPRDYEIRFQMVLWVFRHQLVFCPRRGCAALQCCCTKCVYWWSGVLERALEALWFVLQPTLLNSYV